MWRGAITISPRDEWGCGAESLGEVLIDVFGKRLVGSAGGVEAVGADVTEVVAARADGPIAGAEGVLDHGAFALAAGHGGLLVDLALAAEGGVVAGLAGDVLGEARASAVVDDDFAELFPCHGHTKM